MIKGWRNDPRWVEYFARKKEAALNEEIDRRKAQASLDRSFADVDHALRLANRKPVKFKTGY